MTNLLRETLEYLKENGKRVEDIIWIGSSDGKYILPLSDMKTVLNVEYESGYGCQEIASDLVIVGKDWWMERHEYDGSEWWKFKELPTLSENAIPISKAHGGAWDDIKEIMEKK